MLYATTALNRIDVTKNFTQVLCICCTVESAKQTGIVLAKMGVYMNAKVGFAIMANGVLGPFGKDCHIIVGTPKEIASCRILGYFEMKKIVLAIFDDADVITTTDLVQRHILRQLPANCQKMYISATSNMASLRYFTRTDTIKHISPINIPTTIEHHTIECDTDKYEKLLSIVHSIVKHRGKVIVFCSVCIYNNSYII